MSGFVYCMISEGIPNYIKVGFSLNINNRIIALSTGVPFNFECKFYIEIKKELMANTEKKIHKDIVDAGFEKKKEFFKCNPEDIVYIFEKYGIVIYDKLKQNDTIVSKCKIINNNNKQKEYIQFNCIYCNYFTNIKCNYLKHIKSKSHIENEYNNKLLKCEDCDKNFVYETAYSNHIQKCHKNNDSKILDSDMRILLLEQENKFLKEKSEIENKLKKELSKTKDKHIEYLRKTNRMK